VKSSATKVKVLPIARAIHLLYENYICKFIISLQLIGKMKSETLLEEM